MITGLYLQISRLLRPKAADLEASQLEDARIELLSAQAAKEDCDAWVAKMQKRVDRLAIAVQLRDETEESGLVYVEVVRNKRPARMPL